MFVSDGALVSTKTPLNIMSGNSNYFPYMPGMSTSGWPSAYGGMYSSQLWVNVVIAKRARATARLPLPVYERNEMSRERVDAHPLAALLRNPNPAMTSFDLWLWTASTFDIYGDTAWYKKRAAGSNRIVGLFPLHPSSLSYDEGRWNFDNGKLKLTDIPREDLVLFADFNPDSLVRGLSRLEPLRATLENEWHARRATSSFWERGARPGTYLVHKGNLSQPAQDRLKLQMDSISAGSGKTGVTVVLEEGLEPKPMMLTAEEAQYIETRKLNREEVCAAYDVPPPVVHILDRATFSNITEQMRSMYRDTMGAILPGYESAIDRDLIRVDYPSDGIYTEFLLDEVLRGDFETRAAALKAADWMTIAEKRKVENLPFIDGTDRIWINSAEQPMAMPSSGDAPAAPPFAQVGLPALIAAGVITEQDARGLLGIDGTAPGLPALPESLPLKAAQTAVGRLAWQTSLDQVDIKALVADLNGSTWAVLKALDTETADQGDVASLRHRILSMAKD